MRNHPTFLSVSSHSLPSRSNHTTLRLDRHGWLVQADGIKLIPSPNYNDRPKKQPIKLLVIHNISLPPQQFGGPYIEQLFTNTLDINHHPFFKTIAHLRVSTHFLIRRNGEIIQFVSTLKRAWHAGISCFEGQENCNDFSIGIELEGSDFEPYTDIQYTRLAILSNVLKQRYPLRYVRGHEHIAPIRKTDPGPFFNWNRYREEAQWSWRALPYLTSTQSITAHKIK